MFFPTRLAKINGVITKINGIVKIWVKRGPAYTGTYLEVNLAKCFKVLKMYLVFSTTIPFLGLHPKIITRL